MGSVWVLKIVVSRRKPILPLVIPKPFIDLLMDLHIQPLD